MSVFEWVLVGLLGVSFGLHVVGLSFVYDLRFRLDELAKNPPEDFAKNYTKVR